MAKPVDVPTYVEYGVADIGIVGKDVLMEENKDVYELLDLDREVPDVGHRAAELEAGHSSARGNEVSERGFAIFSRAGQQVEVIKLNGSIELAPLIGLADRIVDMVETGQTLQENGLVEMETCSR